ncbi:c-type cytochrome [Verrucomicrobiales bacterium BCK34]|nr:c-type cytochrome [Verrucomicrobiales bacterium BCK34]
MKQNLTLLLIFALAPCLGAETGAEITALARNTDAVKQGETIYKQMCFACHGMNLEGAAGPNLIDATWIHGATPGDWFKVITKGVGEKGMMAYEAVYDETTRKNLAAYILSKQEGLRGFRYEIYPPVEDDSVALPVFGSGEPIKSGEIPDALVDLSPAEMQEFSIAFKGKFLVPEKGKYIFIHQTRDGRFRMKLNDNLSESASGNKKRTRVVFDLDAGEYDMEVAYQRTDGTPHLLLFEVETPSGIKFPLSRDTHQILTTATHVYQVTDQARVVRTVLENIPHESLAVGLPGGVSFTIGRDGSIYSIWDGLFIDVGPNVSERGKQASKTGAPWFMSPKGIQLLIDDKPVDLRLKEYQLATSQSPVFTFAAANGGTVTVQAESSDPAELKLHYSLEGIEGEAQLSIPAGVRLIKEGEIPLESTTIPIKDPKSFSLSVYKS